MGKERWTALLLIMLTRRYWLRLPPLILDRQCGLTTQDRQPVAFSHQVHAGELNIACLYCHRYASTSPTAAVPTVSVCMSCHRSIEHRLIRKCRSSWDIGNEKNRFQVKKCSLQRLPDFVYFTHEMHVKGRLQCADCHGRARKQMRGTPRAPTYEMGWCLTCHRQREASDDCWTCHKSKNQTAVRLMLR